MNAQLLIDAVVQQVTVLIAQLATSGGLRAPVAHIANQVFVQLAAELEAQGVSRKVSADMFGMALRAYQRKLRRLVEAETEPGSTLWRAVLEHIRERAVVVRSELDESFCRDDPRQLQAVLADLVEGGLVFRSGTGRRAAFRAASEEELGRLAQLSNAEGLDQWLWVMVYRDGPLSVQQLSERVARSDAELQPLLKRLIAEGRVQQSAEGQLSARHFVLPRGAHHGWEAAVFDHLKAVVQTVSQRLQLSENGGQDEGHVGGSTYGFDVWPGHPLEAEVLGLLQSLREQCGQLRTRVEAYNRDHDVPSDFREVVSYVGQCAFDRTRPNGEEHDEDNGE